MSKETAGEAPVLNEHDVRPAVGIITALPHEYAAVKVLLESQRSIFTSGRGAGRQYLYGEVPAPNGGWHRIVLALLPDTGNGHASAGAALLLTHFPSIHTVIMSGIAGGVPNPNKPAEHVRLGDIVVTNREGVVQYDFGKEENIDGKIEFSPRHPPRPPSAGLVETARLLQARELEGERPWVRHIERGLERLSAVRPHADTDVLVSSADPDEVISHPNDARRVKDLPRVFLGPVASSNTLLKNPFKRDQLRDRFGVKAVEMEGSGIADAAWTVEVQYLVVRGVCDYCDRNKGDDWQVYAAVVAAAYTKALLEATPSRGIYFEHDGNSAISHDKRKTVRHNLISMGTFVGREKYKGKIFNALLSNWQLVVISGSGGIGKTALALACAYEVVQAIEEDNLSAPVPTHFDSIVWISARERNIGIDDILDTIARRLEYENSQITTLPLEKKQEEVIHLLRSNSTLIILDNYDGVADIRVGEFLKSLPISSKALITSRKRLRQLENALCLSLKPLPSAEAQQLVGAEIKRLGIEGSNIRSQHISSLIKTVGGIPLALKWAIGLAVEEGKSFEEVNILIGQGKGDIFEFLFGHAWIIIGSLGQSVLMSAAMFSAPPVKSALNEVSSLEADDFDYAVSKLIELSLFEPMNLGGGGSVRFAMHPLTRHFAKSKVAEDSTFYNLAIRRMADYYVEFSGYFPTSHNWEGYTLDPAHEDIQIIINLAHALEKAGEWQRLLKLRSNTWYMLTIKGYWKERIVLDEIAVRAADQVGDRTIKPWVLVHTLSWIAFKQGKTDLSADYCKEGLKLFEDLKDEQEIAFSHVRLGLIALENKDIERAEDLLTKALSYATKAKNQDLTLWSLGILGDLYCELKKVDIGRKYLLSGLELAQQLGWPVRIGLLMNKLGYSFLMEGKLDEAREYFNECIVTLKESKGSHVDIYARANLGLAMVLYKEGRLDQASKHYKEASKLLSGLQITEEYLNAILRELSTQFTDRLGKLP